MSTATLTGVGNFNVSPPDMQRLTTYTSDKFPRCGTRDPTTFCLELPHDSAVLTSMKLEKGAVGGNSLMLSLVVLLFLMLERLRQADSRIFKCSIIMRLRDVSNTFKAIGTPTGHMMLPWSIEHRRRFLHVLVECLYAVVWALYIVLFAYFLHGLTYPSNGAKTTPVNAWTFGQIVAITVWAVPIFEFAKLSIGKYCSFYAC